MAAILGPTPPRPRSHALARDGSHRRRASSDRCPCSWVMRRSAAWMRRALTSPRPEERIAAATAPTGASRTASHVANRVRSRSKALPLLMSLVFWERMVRTRVETGSRVRRLRIGPETTSSSRSTRAALRRRASDGRPSRPRSAPPYETPVTPSATRHPQEIPRRHARDHPDRHDHRGERPAQFGEPSCDRPDQVGHPQPSEERQRPARPAPP